MWREWSALRKLIWLRALLVKAVSYIWAVVSGASPLTLSQSLAHPIKALTHYGKCVQRNLPAEYTELEYIEGDGAAYIDLGFKLTQDDNIEVDFALTTSQAAKYIFGNRGGDASANNIALFFASTANKIVVDFNNSDYSLYRAGPSDALTTGVKYSAVLNKSKRGIYNGATTIVENTTVCADTIETAGNATIFGGYYQNGAVYTANNFTGRVYRVTIAGKHDLRPAKNSSDVVGMYDLVTGQFFTNAGAGAFTAGPNSSPTLEHSMDLWCNNGKIKVSLNMAGVNEQTALVGYYISAQGVVTVDANNWIYQDYIPVKPNTTYTLSMSAPVYYVSISEYSTADDSGFIIRKAGGTGSNTSLTITTGDNTNFIRFGTNIDRAGVTLERVLAINWMLNKGSVAVPYTPYVEGGLYTDGTPEVLTVRGQNLIDYTFCQNRTRNGITTTRNSDGSITLTGTSDGGYRYWNASDTMNLVLPAGTYQLSEHIELDSADGDCRGTFTLAEERTFINAYFLGFGNGETVNVTLYPLLTVASTVQTATVENLLATGNFGDTQEIIAGLKDHRVRAVIFDGTEDFYQATSNPYKLYLQVPRDGRQAFNNVKVFCSHFKPAETATWAGLQVGECLFEGNDGDNYSFDFYPGNIDRFAFRAKLADLWVAGTPLFMLVPNWDYYDHGQVPEQVTPQSLHSYKGTTVISIEANVDPVALMAEYAQVQ